MLNEILGLHSQFFNLYEVDIRPRKYILFITAPTKKTIPKVGYGKYEKVWTPEDQRLLERLKE